MARALDIPRTSPTIPAMFRPRFLVWHFTHPPGPDPNARRRRTYYIQHPLQAARVTEPLQTLAEIQKAIREWWGRDLPKGAYTSSLYHLRTHYGVEALTVEPSPDAWVKQALWSPNERRLILPSHWTPAGPERVAYGPHDPPLGITHVSTPHGQILRVSPLGYVSTRTTTRPANTPWKAITPVSVELAPTLDRPRVNFLTRELLTPEGTGIKV